ncbi:hypothetical protein IGI96_000898 [Enterococcus sp. DIV0421]|uniref:phage tail protein n=1 Tax=Enterococcus sp. DIV0421 TaxID=2774688 RepID=UPI003F2031EB
MIHFIDETGKQHVAIAECQKTKGVNGEKSLSGTIYTNNEVLEGIGRGWRIQFEDDTYCLIYVNPIDEGNRIIIEFDAVHEFFFDMKKSCVYGELSGSNTAKSYLDFIFEDSDYDYRLEVTVPAFEKENFGMKNRLDLFKDFISSTGVEFSVSGKIVRILEKVGTNLSTIVKKGFNLNQLRIEKDSSEFITYLKGYGAFIDPEDESQGRLEVEYLSPLADIYGVLEGDPIIDERYSIANNFIERLKSEVEESYTLAVSIDMEDLTQAGYEYDQPHEGDYIMAINKDLGFEQKIRIMSYTTSYDTEGNIIDHDVSCGSENIIQKSISRENKYRKEVQEGIKDAVSTANLAWISADGKNKVFQGTDRPTAANKGDIWYQVDGEQTIMNYWNGFDWVPFINPDEVQEAVDQAKQAGEQAQAAADQAGIDASTALSNANIAVNKANEASSKADQSNIAANQAKTDAASAIANVSTAVQNAQLAITNAQNALNAAVSAQNDAQEAIDKYEELGMYPAWAWSEDGTDRFTTQYPNENGFANSESPAPFKSYSGTAVIKTDNVSVPEWGATNAVGYKVTGGTATILGTLHSGMPNAIVGETHDYDLSIYVKNTGTTNILVSGNITSAVLVAPGEAKRLTWVIKNYSHSTGAVRQFVFNRQNTTDEANFVVWHAKIAYGSYTSIWTPRPVDDFANAYPTYVGFSNEKSTNPADYIWIKEPKKIDSEVKVELSEINGELSRKVSQDTFNILEGTVENHTTEITQNTNAITQKADSSTVNTLTGRVSTAEGQITTIAGQIELKANKTDVETVSGKVTSVESTLTTQAGQITALNTKTDGHATQIGSLQSSYSGLSSTVSSVRTDLDNLSVGARNYLPNSESPKFDSYLGSSITYTTGVAVDEWKATNAVRHEVSGGTGGTTAGTLRANRLVAAGVKYIHSIYIKNEGTTTVRISNNLSKYINVPAGTTTRLVFEPSAHTAGTAAMQFVLHRINASDVQKFVVWHAMIAEGTVVNDWVPAPEDLATVSAMSNLTQTVETIQATVADKVSQAQFTILNNQVTTTVSDVSTLGGKLDLTDVKTRLAGGLVITDDPEFRKGNNGITTYNNSGNGNVVVERQSVPASSGGTQPTTSDYRMMITVTGTASPGFGGVVRLANARINAKFVVRFIANLPSSRSFAHSYNSLGTQGKVTWLTDRIGRGTWTEYMYLVECGTGGTFSTFGHLYVTNGETPTVDNPLKWYLARYEIIDITQAQQTQITQLSDSINLRVEKNDVVNQINISTEDILIAGNKIRITGQTTIDNGVIKTAQIADLSVSTAKIADAAITNAKIGSISANKVTTGTLNASNVSIINMNAANITTGYLSSDRIQANSITADKLAANAIMVGLNSSLSSLQLSSTSITFSKSGTKTSAITDQGQEFWYGTRKIGYLGSTSKVGNADVRGIAMNLEDTGDFMTWGYKETASSSSYTAMLTLDPKGKFTDSSGLSIDVTAWMEKIEGKGGTLEIGTPGAYQSVKFCVTTYNNTKYPALLNESGDVGVFFGSTELYLVRNNTVYSLNNIITVTGALKGLGTVSIPTRINSDGTVQNWKNITL